MLPGHESGNFATKTDEQGKTLFNEYDCRHCLSEGTMHTVDSVPHGSTDQRSCWGPGLPTTRRQCSACGRWDDPGLTQVLLNDILKVYNRHSFAYNQMSLGNTTLFSIGENDATRSKNFNQ